MKIRPVVSFCPPFQHKTGGELMSDTQFDQGNQTSAGNLKSAMFNIGISLHHSMNVIISLHSLST